MKKVLLVLLLGLTLSGVFGCSSVNNDSKIDTEESKQTEMDNSMIQLKYVNGLYARSETNDMMLALYILNDKPMAIITELGNTYMGGYNTEDAKLSDGTEYTKITVQNKTYGYHFDDEWVGFVVDQEGNKYEAKKLDESVAMDVFKGTLMTK